MRIAKMPELNVILLGKVVEMMRESIASRLYHLVYVKCNLVLHLLSLKNYFLLQNGQFYHTFLDEARALLALPPSSSAEQDLNVGPLEATMAKLDLEDDAYIKRFKFRIRSFSFSFRNFNSLTGLIYIGDVGLDRNKAFRFTSQKQSTKSGSLWHSLKQKLDQGFYVSFALRNKNNLLTELQPKYKQDTFKGPEQPAADLQIVDSSVRLVFIIQNEKEVSPWKTTPPMCTADLNEYIAIHFLSTIQGTVPLEGKASRAKPNLQVRSFIQVWCAQETNLGRMRDVVEGQVQHKTEKKLMEVEVTREVDFMNQQDFHKVKIEVEKDTLKVYLVKVSAAEPALQIPLRLQDYLNLDNGSAYLGFMHET